MLDAMIGEEAHHRAVSEGNALDESAALDLAASTVAERTR
jgi:hypothetical protein